MVQDADDEDTGAFDLIVDHMPGMGVPQHFSPRKPSRTAQPGIVGQHVEAAGQPEVIAIRLRLTKALDQISARSPSAALERT